jgi:hypothetical protein
MMTKPSTLGNPLIRASMLSSFGIANFSAAVPEPMTAAHLGSLAFLLSPALNAYSSDAVPARMVVLPLLLGLVIIPYSIARSTYAMR